MTSEDGRWDPATVLGLRSSDRVLVVGNPAFLTWLTQVFVERPDNLISVRRTAEVEALLKEGRGFDRVVLSRETPYSHDHVLRAGAMHAQLVCFPADDGWSVEQSVEFYYPDARMWKLDSTFGTIVVAEPHGASWRMLYA